MTKSTGVGRGGVRKLPEPLSTLARQARGNRSLSIGLVEPIRNVINELKPLAPGSRRVMYNLLQRYRHVPAVMSLIKAGEAKDNDPKARLVKGVEGTLTVMRDIGLVHPDEVADNRAEVVDYSLGVANAAEYLEDLRSSAEHSYRHNRMAGQPYRVEVWTEAADTLPALEGLADKYGVVVASASGSITYDPVARLGERMALDAFYGHARPVKILYLGDFDPAGLSIPDTIKHAETQASRWYMYLKLRTDRPEGGYPYPSQQAAWRAACARFPNGSNKIRKPLAEVEIIRLAVVQTDLDLPGVETSPVKEFSVIRQYDASGRLKPGSGSYARWWPEGERRTLQLEGLTVEEVVSRVEANLIELVDQGVLDEVLAVEEENRREVVEGLAGLVDHLIDNDDDEA